MAKVFYVSLKEASAVIVGVLLLTQIGSAQVRSSSNYQLQTDSLNVGGGLSTSTNFLQESTVGEIATGRATSSNYQLRAGYQQMQSVFLSMTAPNDVTMNPGLPGITGGTSNGSTTVTVITDNPAGYALFLRSEGDPAMQSPNGNIPNYNITGAPDFDFVVASGEAFFGFSPSGIDTTAAFLDDGFLCSEGSTDTPLACWSGLTTSDTEIARGTSGNQSDGATTTINFRVRLGSDANIIAGEYTATTTVTVLPL